MSSSKIRNNEEMIDIIFRFIKEILYSNIRFPGISQEAVITLNQITYMSDDILYEYLYRSITIFKYMNSDLGKNNYIYHLLFTYSYY